MNTRMTSSNKLSVFKRFSFFVRLIIVATAVSPAFALGSDQRNLFLIGVMSICPILLVLVYKKIYQADLWLVLFMISTLFMPLAFNPESMRWSTVLYTLMYGFTYLAYSQLLHRNYYTIVNYMDILKYLIYAYALVLLMQQFCVLTGLPIINVSNYRPGEPWKLNSLTSEPSHSARIVALLMYCYIITKELVARRPYNFNLDFRHDKWVWMGFVWTMVTMGSGTAYLFISVFMMKFVRFKTFIKLAAIFCVTIFLTEITGVTNYEQSINLLIAIVSFDVVTIFELGGSAAYRIVPVIILFQMVDITTLYGWLGHGVDHVGSFLSFRLPGVPEGSTGGGLLQLWMDFGFVSFMLFMIFSFQAFFRSRDYMSLLFWFMLVFLQGINNQILWLCLILLSTNKYFVQRVGKLPTRNV